MEYAIIGWLPTYMRYDLQEEQDVFDAVKTAIVNDIREHGYWLRFYDCDGKFEPDECHGVALLNNGKYVWIDDSFSEELLKLAYGEHMDIFSCMVSVRDNYPYYVLNPEYEMYYLDDVTDFVKTVDDECDFSAPEGISLAPLISERKEEYDAAQAFKKQVRAICDEIVERVSCGIFSKSDKNDMGDLKLFTDMFDKLFVDRRWINCDDANACFDKVCANAKYVFESVMLDLCEAGIAYKFRDNEVYGIENYYYACNSRILPHPKAQTTQNKKIQFLVMQMLDTDTVSSVGEISTRLDASFDEVKIAMDELVRIGDAEFFDGRYCATHKVKRHDVADIIPTLDERGYKVATLVSTHKKGKKDE